MPYRVVRLARTRIVLTKLDERALGYAVWDVLVSLHAARALTAAVWLVRPEKPPNEGLLEVSSAEVRVLPGSGVWRVLGWVLWSLGELRALARMRLAAAARALRPRQEAQPAAGETTGGWERRRLAYQTHLAAARRQRARSYALPPDVGIDQRESHARHPVPVALLPRLAARLEGEAAALGLVPGLPLVALHARESGYKGVGGDRPTDAMRNARIETYFPAIDRLTEMGYVVVRIGDSSMRPVERRGLVDLATSPARNDFLELWCVLNAKLFVACDSGPYLLSWLTQTPCLAVNMTNPISGYPLLASHQYILKHVVHVPSGRVLSLREMIGRDYLFARKNLELYRYLDNTPEDIATAVTDALDFLRDRPPPTPSQREYRRLIEEALADPVLAELATKSTGRRFYLGEGRIAASFGERYLDAAADEEGARSRSA